MCLQDSDVSTDSEPDGCEKDSCESSNEMEEHEASPFSYDDNPECCRLDERASYSSLSQKRPRGRPPKLTRPDAPDLTPSGDDKAANDTVKVHVDCKTKVATKISDGLPLTDKATSKVKKVTACARKSARDSEANRSKDSDMEAVSKKPDSSFPEHKAAVRRKEQSFDVHSAGWHKAGTTPDTGVYDFQSDDTESYKSFQAVPKKTALTEHMLRVKKYWMPPADFVDREITITDVVSNGLPITFRESRSAEFLT